MAAAGLGHDLLLANEVLDPARLATMAAAQDHAQITIAVDSAETVVFTPPDSRMTFMPRL